MRARLVPPRGRVLIALSGGVDSMTLLHLIRTTFPNAQIAAAHFDHGWRSGSADDAAWVRDQCAGLGITCVTGRADAMTGTAVSEAAGRTARYAFLRGAAGAWKASRILMAHHADDQVETVLFRMARGAGTRGLAGIPDRRGRIARPLLPFRRATIEAYARAHGLEWREDPSNADMRFARNRIRHWLLPALERSAPGAVVQLLELGHLSTTAESLWRRELRRVLKHAVIEQDETRITLASDLLLGYHPTVHARALRTLAARLGSSLDRSGTRRGVVFVGRSRSGTAIDLGGGLQLAREFDTLIVRRTEWTRSVPVDVRIMIPSAGDGAGEAVIGGRRVRVRWEMSFSESGSGVAFDPGQVRFPLELRGWAPGDRIGLSGGSKKLKKLFVERRVERSRRSSMPVLAECGGRVLWLPGIARAAGGVPVSGSPVFCIRLEA